MHYKETITDWLRDLEQVSTSSDDKEALKLRIERLNVLKTREQLLVTKVGRTLTPVLERLNRDYYEGKGTIKITPLSDDPRHRGTDRYAHAYERYIYREENVRTEIKIELFKGDNQIPSCYFRIWEKDKKGREEVQAYFPSMPARIETYTGFFGLVKARNVLDGDDWQMFDLSKPGSFYKLENYVKDCASRSPYFGLNLNK